MRKKCVRCGREFLDFAGEDRCGECVAEISRDDYIEVKIRTRGEVVELRVPMGNRSQSAAYTRHHIHEFINYIHHEMSVKQLDDDGKEIYEPPCKWRLGKWTRDENEK